MKLSKHFALNEFEVSRTAEVRGIDNSVPQQYILSLMQLCEGVLEPIRAHFGPVTITSGYRCAELNKAIGGSNHSQHSLGEAADITVSSHGVTEVCDWISASDIVFDQLIYEGRWTHISYGSRMRRSVLTAHFNPGHKTTYTPGIDHA